MHIFAALNFEIKTTKRYIMARVCDLSGKKMLVGNYVSHSNKKTKRRFYPNLQEKKVYIPEKKKWIKLKVSTSMLRTIDKKGISAVIREAKAQGLYE